MSTLKENADAISIVIGITITAIGSWAHDPALAIFGAVITLRPVPSRNRNEHEA